MGYKHLKFPEGSKFLVTGGAGFIGSNLCEAILNMGYKVRCLDDLSTGKQANVDMFLGNPNYEFIKRQPLHSASLTFSHPITGQEMHLEADVPDDMKRLFPSFFEKSLQ